MEYRYFVSSSEMKQYDAAAIRHFGMPALVLMERAALAVAEEIEARCEKGGKALIVSGCGNNGGDGIAVGRILMQRGWRTDFVLIGDRNRCSEETKCQLSIIEKYGCLMQSKIEDKEYDIIVDAIFGTGLSRPAEGIYAQAIWAVNRKKGRICAVDIPSGINADTGEVMNAAVKADFTVALAFEKLGHILYPGCEYAGEVVCRDIGITKECFLGERPRVYSYGERYKNKLKELLPARDPGGNKGSFGKALLIAGSRNMSGACELCAKGCYRIGAGMVKIVTEEGNRQIVQRGIPEALLSIYKEGTIPDNFSEDMEWADGIIIGPGIGTGESAFLLLKEVIEHSAKPLVIDADGLNLLAKSEKLRQSLARRSLGRGVILTPHAAEFARLCGCSVKEAKETVLKKAKELADACHCTVVCKDARTVAASFEEESIYINTTGNDALATAGSGDVLAGIIGGLFVQGMQAFPAACAGIFIHGRLGDAAARRMGSYAVMAGDLAEQIKIILADEGILK